MTQRDRPAVDIHFRRVELELAHAGDRLRGEGLVQLDEIDLVDFEPGPLEHLLSRRNGTQAHATGIHSRHRRGDDARQWLGRRGGDEESGGPVVYAARARPPPPPPPPERGPPLPAPPQRRARPRGL